MKKKKHASQYGACDSKGEGDDEKVIQTDEILYFQVSCKPYGSKLRKPTKFFIQAFAKMTNSDSKEFTVFNVSYLKDDEFVISTSAKHFDGMQCIFVNSTWLHDGCRLVFLLPEMCMVH